MSMSNKTYDTLKWIAQYLLPAVDTFLGVLLGISSAQYNKTEGK